MSGCREALLWEPRENGKVACNLCAHRCVLSPGGKGVCLVRWNEDGRLCTATYGKLVSANPDPIEKKPLFHFLPGTRSMSIATVGCNLTCRYCQNWSIAHWPRLHRGNPLPGEYVPPEELVAAAARTGCASISYTYTEPTIFFEYALDTARLATDKGLKNVFVTNGYMTRQALELLKGLLHAANVDLKTMDDQVLFRLSGAHVQPVLDSIRTMKEFGIWVEVTTLVVPGLNDSDEQLRAVARFLVDLDPGIPWHVSRFHPDYKMVDRQPTPPETLARACEIGRDEGLEHVYSGNLWGDDNESTYCPKCGTLLIRRYGFSVLENNLLEGRCPACGRAIAGVWGA